MYWTRLSASEMESKLSFTCSIVFGFGWLRLHEWLSRKWISILVRNKQINEKNHWNISSATLLFRKLETDVHKINWHSKHTTYYWCQELVRIYKCKIDWISSDKAQSNKQFPFGVGGSGTKMFYFTLHLLAIVREYLRFSIVCWTKWIVIFFSIIVCTINFTQYKRKGK